MDEAEAHRAVETDACRVRVSETLGFWTVGLPELVKTPFDRHRGGSRLLTLPQHGANGSVHSGSRCYAIQFSNREGRPSERKYAFEAPTEKALDRTRYQRPRPLPAVLAATRGRTPSCSHAARR